MDVFGVGDGPLYNIHLLRVYIGTFVQSSVIEQFYRFGAESLTKHEICICELLCSLACHRRRQPSSLPLPLVCQDGLLFKISPVW